MTSKELSLQAFELDNTIKAHSYRVQQRSGHKKRLFCLGLRAFYRFKRRLQVEQNQDYIYVASRWGF